MFNVSVEALMQHLLFLFLLVVAPIWDLYDTRKLKRNPSSEQKIRYYKTLCTWLWIASALAVVAIGFRPLITISPTPGEDRKSTRLNSSHSSISYAVFCL